MSAAKDRALRLRRLTEREIDPTDLARIVGGIRRGGPTETIQGIYASRYCATGDQI